MKQKVIPLSLHNARELVELAITEAESKKGKFEVVVRQVRKQRSNPQNALYWLWVSYLVGETGNEKEDTHEALKQQFIDPREIHLYFTTLEYTPSTAALDTAEFTEFLRKVHVYFASEFGINLPYPEDRHYAEINARYG